MSYTSMLMWMVVGVLIGVLSGFMGVGGGVVLTPILIYIGFKPSAATVTSLAFIIPTAWAGMMRSKQDIDVNLSVLLAVGAVIGTYAIGRPLVEKIDPTVFKRAFGVLLLIVALDLLFGVSDALKKKANATVKQPFNASMTKPN